jgi:hypothetical protein
MLVLDLYTTEPVLGEDRLVRAARVSFGRPMIYPVRPGELDPLLDRRPDRDQRKFMLLHFPFDLEPPAPNRRYESATVRVDFDDDSVTALDVSRTASHDDETVDLDIRGIGRSVIAWDLRPGDPRTGLRPRSRVMQVILDVPIGSTELHGALSAELTIARIRGNWPTRSATSQRPRRFTLSTDGTFTAEPAK